jgi:hypothetical protein
MVLSILVDEPGEPQPQIVYTSTPYPKQAYQTMNTPITPTGSTPVMPPPSNPTEGQ